MVERQNVLDVLGIVLSYNRKELLRRAIETVKEQLPPNSEIVCAENGNDEGYKIAQELGCIIIKNDSNVGVSIAINRAARARPSRNLLLFHDDIVLWPGGFDRLVAAGAPIVCGQALHRDGRYWGEMGFDEHNIPKMFSRERPAAAKSAVAGLFYAALINRRCWELLNGLDERLTLDYMQFDFCLRAGLLDMGTAMSDVIMDHAGGPKRTQAEVAISQRDISEFWGKWEAMLGAD